MDTFGEQGYVLKQAYFSAEECAELKQAFDERSLAECYFQMKTLGFHDIKNQAIKTKVQDMIKDLNQKYGLKLNAAPDGCAFFETDPSKTWSGVAAYEDWHQDHTSFYMSGDHFSYLNIYVTVYKEDPSDANLGVIPFDALRKKSLAAYVQALGAGATVWSQKSDGDWETHPRLAHSQFKVDPETKMIRFDDSSGKATQYHFMLDDIQTTHHLHVGDVMIMRGDLIHRRQPFKTRRIALSLRVTSDHSVVSRSHFLNTCPVKMHIACPVANAWPGFANAWAYMAIKGKSLMPWGEVKPWINYVLQPSTLKVRERAQFYLYRSLFYAYVRARGLLMQS